MYTKCLLRKHKDASTPSSVESDKAIKGSLAAGGSSRQRPPSAAVAVSGPVRGSAGHPAVGCTQTVSCFQVHYCDFQEFLGRFGKQRNRI